MSEIIYPDEAKARVRELLSQLAKLTDARDLREMDRQAAIHLATPEEVRIAIRDINAEFDEHLETVNASIAETEAELRTVGVFTGETVTDANAGYQIVFSNGRTTYDAKALDAIIGAPGNEWLSKYRVDGKPSVSIRKVKRG